MSDVGYFFSPNMNVLHLQRYCPETTAVYRCGHVMVSQPICGMNVPTLANWCRLMR
jgi:adenine-specific DNA methylase